MYDIDSGAEHAFAREVEKAGLTATIAASPRQAFDLADVVVTGGPIEPDTVRSVDADWLRPGHLGVTIDYDCYWRPTALMAADRLFTDDFNQIEHIKEYGYFVGCPRPQAELGSVVAGLAPGRSTDDQKLVVLNMGVAVEDVATAREIFEIARANNIGIPLPM